MYYSQSVVLAKRNPHNGAPRKWMNLIIKKTQFIFNFTSLKGARSTKILLRWAFTPEVCTEEVLSNPDLRFSYCPQTFVRDPPAPHTPPVSPFFVHISATSVLDLRTLITSTPSGDYGFSVFVKPATLNDYNCILHYKSDDGRFDMKFLSTDSGTNASVIGWDSCAFDALQVGQWQPIAVDAKHQSSQKSLRKRLLMTLFWTSLDGSLAL